MSERHGGGPVPEVEAGEVLRRLQAGEPLHIVDIREPFEWYHTGVIPGARLSPMRTFLLQELEGLDRDQELILVCQSGMRTLGAAAYMAMKGFTRVRSMAGGMKAWRGPVVPPQVERLWQ